MKTTTNTRTARYQLLVPNLSLGAKDCESLEHLLNNVGSEKDNEQPFTEVFLKRRSYDPKLPESARYDVYIRNQNIRNQKKPAPMELTGFTLFAVTNGGGCNHFYATQGREIACILKLIEGRLKETMKTRLSDPIPAAPKQIRAIKSVMGNWHYYRPFGIFFSNDYLGH